MMTIPLAHVPSQVVSATLGGQAVRLKVYQRRAGLFIDVFVDDSMELGGALCRDRVLILRDAYLSFAGDLVFLDTQGTSDPEYTVGAAGIGSRFSLIYVEVADFAAMAI